MVTLVTVSFVATTVAYLLSLADKIGPISIRAFDPAASGAYFGAVLAAYTGHHWVNTKYGPSTPPVTNNAPNPTQQGPIVGG